MKELLDKLPESGYITRSNHGQQMRGHTGCISYDADADSLHFYNSYFGSSVDQTHNLSTNAGKIDVRVQVPFTKYLDEFQQNLQNHHNALGVSAYVCTAKEDVSISLRMPNYSVTLGKFVPGMDTGLAYTVYYNGFKKLGHYDNISLIKEVKSKLRAYKATVKENRNNPAFLDSIVCNNTNGILELHASPLMLD